MGALRKERVYTKYTELDIYVLCDKSKLDDRGCHGAPVWIVDKFKERISVYNFG